MTGKRIGKPFEAGKSGNPGGRPKIPQDVKDIAKGYSVDAIETLAQIMMDAEQSGPARVSAAGMILDRGYGKPAQHITTERVETLSDHELAAEFAATIDALRALGIDPTGVVAGSGDKAQGAKRNGSGLTH